MSSTEFAHTAEFFETIFCFSLLVLIGQQVVLVWKQLNDQYIGKKIKQFNDEQQWLREKLNIVSQPSHAEYKNKAQEPQVQNKIQQQIKPQKQQTLRNSLVEKDNDQTDRSIYQNPYDDAKNNNKRISIDTEGNQQKQQRSSLTKRKSLTDLRKQQINNQVQQIEIKDESDASVSRRVSVDSQKGQSTFNVQNKLQKKSKQSSSGKIERKLQKLQDPNYQQPSVVNSNYSDHDGQFRNEIKAKFKLQVLRQIDIIFDQHLAIIVPLLILGIIVHSTYIFTIVCSFGYVFSHLLMNYTLSGQNQQQQPSLFSRKKLGIIVPKIWIIAIFINYWADTQFS